MTVAAAPSAHFRRRSAAPGHGRKVISLLWGPAGAGAGQDREQDMRGVPGVMVDLEPAPQRPGRHAEGLRGPEVAGEPRERAPADLHPDPVPGLHPVRRRVELQVDRQDPVVASTATSGAGTVCGLSRRMPSVMLRRRPEVDVTDPDEQVGVLAVGAHEDPGADRPDQVRAGREGIAGERQDVGPGLDRRVVDLLARRLQERSSGRGRRVRGVVDERAGRSITGLGVRAQAA